jgi:hypothetical protein
MNDLQFGRINLPRAKDYVALFQRENSPQGDEQEAGEKARTRRAIMKTTFLAAAAALVLGVGPAYAGDGGGGAPNTFFTELPGVIAQAPGQDNHAYAAGQNGPVYASQQRPGAEYPWLPRG